ncbi:hypothetical protein JXQ31_18890 [candidate division KSB1 bacterium]|nr:hypothetical protein [candidate division KSB1 bacterium]
MAKINYYRPLRSINADERSFSSSIPGTCSVQSVLRHWSASLVRRAPGRRYCISALIRVYRRLNNIIPARATNRAVRI